MAAPFNKHSIRCFSYITVCKIKFTKSPIYIIHNIVINNNRLLRKSRKLLTPHCPLPYPISDEFTPPPCIKNRKSGIHPFFRFSLQLTPRHGPRRILLCLLYSLHIFSGSRVDLDLISLLDEQRNIDRSAGLNYRRLGSAGCGIALKAGFRLGNLKLYE